MLSIDITVNLGEEDHRGLTVGPGECDDEIIFTLHPRSTKNESVSFMLSPEEVNHLIRSLRFLRED